MSVSWWLTMIWMNNNGKFCHLWESEAQCDSASPAPASATGPFTMLNPCLTVNPTTNRVVRSQRPREQRATNCKYGYRMSAETREESKVSYVCHKWVWAIHKWVSNGWTCLFRNLVRVPVRSPVQQSHIPPRRAWKQNKVTSTERSWSHGDWNSEKSVNWK